MGKRRYNLAGLSHFVREAFDIPSGSGKGLQNESEVSRKADTSANGQGTPRRASQRDDLDEDASMVRAVKKRKVGLLGPGHERYDATGRAPYYTDASEVPERLRKCE